MMVDGMWIAAFGSKPAEEASTNNKRKAPSSAGMHKCGFVVSRNLSVVLQVGRLAARRRQGSEGMGHGRLWQMHVIYGTGFLRCCDAAAAQ